MKHKPRIFSIASHNAFLPTFVDALLQGKVIENFDMDHMDPLALANMTIYVPTRRAARMLRAAFLEKSVLETALLPNIRPLGEWDEDEAVFFSDTDTSLALDPPIDPLERLLSLARLTHPWREKLPDYLQALYGGEKITVPVSFADAIWLARDLASLMDEIEMEEADWSKLATLAPEDLAAWWQVSLSFLDIVANYWPQYLAQIRRSNPMAWRVQAIHAQADYLRNHPPHYPVIAAGSTGSMPATAELLKTIAGLEQGAVILPGLDRDMDDESWQSVSHSESDYTIFGHPQFGLKKLLDHIGMLRKDVVFLGGHEKPALRDRETLVSEALRPAQTTDKWKLIGLGADEKQAAFKDVALIEAPNEAEEGLAIAIAMHRALREKDKTVALVTADRTLARRVAAELKRFNITADDSGGIPFSETEPMTLLRLILNVVFRPGDPIAALSLLKHPLTALGNDRAHTRHLVEEFELFALRGHSERIELCQAQDFINRVLGVIMRRDHDDARRLNTDLIEQVQHMAARLEEILKPLTEMRDQSEDISIIEATRRSVMVLESFAKGPDGNLERLYQGEAGEKTIHFMRRLLANQADYTFKPSQWPDIFDAIIANESIKPRAGGHPRAFIWGALEARLQQVDTVIVAGLNEGVWPAAAPNDPFLSRPMKVGLALEPAESRIGLAAHDFQMLIGQKRVILSRSLRRDNAPTIASRWLQRILTVLGEDEAQAIRERGQKYLLWARKIDDAESVDFIERPNPKPALDKRPNHFSVTEIETLRRDPYAIYARKILKLKPLEPLCADPDYAERGSLYHDIVSHYATLSIQNDDADAIEIFMDLAQNYMRDYGLAEDIQVLWLPHIRAIAPHYIAWESQRDVAQKLVEISTRRVMVGKTGVTLSGRADRIDIIDAQYADIFDFKTGSGPSVKQAQSLLAPQLPLEGALLMRGGFECGKRLPLNMAYIRLRPRVEKFEDNLVKKDVDAQTLAQQAWMRLEQLLESYKNPDQGYMSRVMPPVTRYEGDYDHLARVQEWSAGLDQEEAET